MFDFDGRPNTRQVILDDQSGLVVGDHDHSWSY
jgi:hypothetical protein